jgi:hypothetical protein
MTEKEVDHENQIEESGVEGVRMKLLSSPVNPVKHRDQEKETHSVSNSSPVIEPVHSHTEIPKDCLDQLSRSLKTVLGVKSEISESNVDQTKMADRVSLNDTFNFKAQKDNWHD